ncbi:mediator complex, subunit Med18 [Dipodascopsis uninucleata]
MQELALYAAVPDARLSQVHTSLTGLTGMRPLELLDHHIVFTPAASSGSGANQALATAAVTPLEAPRIDVVRSKIDQDSHWTLNVYTIPEAGKRSVQVRAVNRSQALAGSPFKFIRALGYVYAFDYLEKGYIFVYNGIVVVTLTQIAPQSAPQIYEDDELVADAAARSRDLKFSTYLPTWVIKAHVDVARDGVANDQERLQFATDRLEALRYDLRGLISLDIPDRMVLDPRVQIHR